MMIKNLRAVAGAKPVAGSKPALVRAPLAGGLVGAALLQATPAFAAEPATVDSAVEAVINGVKVAGGFVKSGVSAVETGIDIVKQGVEIATPVVKQGVDYVSPYVSEAYEAAASAAMPAIKASLPALNEAISSSGLPISETTSAVAKTADEAISVASPVLSEAAAYVSTADPLVLGEYALGAAAFLYLAPSIFGMMGGMLRGYAGELNAAAAQDAIVNNNAVLVDVRTFKEKEASGVPDLPSAASSKVFEVEFATTEDRKLRSSLRDANALEAQVTALQIAALKKINKGSTLVLLDRYGSTAGTVAKELSAKGFSKVYVLSGGFDGRGGWVASKLQIKPSASALSAPGTVVTTTRKALPFARQA